MKTVLMYQAQLAYPVQTWERDGFKEQLNRYERYSSFLDACGHDTKDLAGAMAGVNTAVEELRRVCALAGQRFDQEPFPFAAVTVDEAMRAAFEESLAKRTRENKENGGFKFGRAGW